nr:MAG TPA: hypothetical protein [Caudoviricetes sp.]
MGRGDYRGEGAKKCPLLSCRPNIKNNHKCAIITHK